MPRVSICIPAYKPRHFEICLASAVAQTYRDFEIIVSDDCRTEEIKAICDKFPGWVKYSRNPTPGGRANILRLMDLAQGEYIKFLFDDDLLDPFCVQLLVQALETTRSQNTRFAYSPRSIIDADNNIMQNINLLNITGPGISVLKGAKCVQLIATNCSNFVGEFTTVLFRRSECFDENGRNTLLHFPEKPSRALGDAIAWVNMAQRGDVAIHPSTLSYFRQHKGSNSDANANPDFFYVISEWEDIVEHARARGYLPGPQLAQAYQSLLRIYQIWAPRFPELEERMRNIRQQLGAVPA